MAKNSKDRIARALAREQRVEFKADEQQLADLLDNGVVPTAGRSARRIVGKLARTLRTSPEAILAELKDD